MHAHTHFDTHYTVCNSFKDWSHTHTHASNESHTLKRVQRETIFSIWGHWANSLSFSWLIVSEPKTAAHVYSTCIAPTEECCELFEGPSMFFPEPHRGFSENKNSNENTCTGFRLILLDTHIHVITIFCFNQELFRTYRCRQLKHYFDSIHFCKRAIFLTDEYSHETTCSY